MIHRDEEHLHQKWTHRVATWSQERKANLKANDYENIRPSSSKRKSGIKSLSVTSAVRAMMKMKAKVLTRLVQIMNLRVYTCWTTNRSDANGLEGPKPSPSVRYRMKKAFTECYRAVLACDDGSGRKRCELFRELPDERMYIPLSSSWMLIIFLLFRLFYYPILSFKSRGS
jgi:hypothetical protein